jgi:ADP-dependent NAD(P)H-hydrate dehydratase / NAD(P)H-hydrate epimerase
VRVLNTQQMREADRQTIEDVGLPSIVLMENAGRQVVAAMESAFESLASMSIAVVCGRGNNGGDGFVVARALIDRSIQTRVALIGESSALKGDARANFEILRALDIDVLEVADAGAWELHGADLLDVDLVVDALVGTGLTAPLSGLYETVVEDINAAPVPVVSIDLPSGLSADSPDVGGPAIDAALTVTLAAPKLPLVLPPGEELAGTLVIADIGIPSAVVNGIDGPWVELLTKDAMRALVPPRAPQSHKGDYGHVLVVAGSPGKTGAAVLAARAALRSGAGLVTVAAPAGCLPLIAPYGPEFMTLALAEDANGLVDAEAAEQVLAFEADVIAAGPGLGRSPGVRAFVRALVEQCAVPLILDADAVVAFAGEPDRLLARDGVDLILTPHPGEMAAITGLSVEDVQANRLAVARDFASTHRAHVVLKGHRTIVAMPEGQTYINLTGNPGMATAGSGDVLLGVVAAWTAQLMDAEAACRLAVYLHGLAGDLAEADEGEIALIAGDIVDRLGDAVLELTARRKKTPPAS